MKGLSRTNNSHGTTKDVTQERVSPKGGVETQTEFWNVIRILKESGKRYLVEWDGIDPKTGGPWKPSWIPKGDCTDALVREWEDKKRRRGLGREDSLQRQYSSFSSSTAAGSVVAAPVKVQDKGGGTPGIKPTHGFQYVEIPRKRPLSPAPKAPPAKVERQPGMRSETSLHSTKRRRIAVDSGEEDHDSTTSPAATQPLVSISPAKFSDQSISRGTDRRLSSRIIAPDSQPSEEGPMQEANDASVEDDTNPLLPIPTMSPSYFREGLSMPLSQIEDFTESDSAIQTKSKSTQGSSKMPGTAKPGSFVSRMTRELALREKAPPAKGHVPKQDVRMQEPGSEISPRTNGQDEPIRASGDADELERVSVERDLEAGQSNSSVVPSNALDAPLVEPDQGPNTKRPVDIPEPDQTEDTNNKWKLKLTAKDATIDALETTIRLMQEERIVHEERFAATIREHVLTQRALEQQVASLTTALKQFGTMTPEGVDAIIQQTPAASEPAPVAMEVAAVVATAPPVHVRTAEDEALITQLQAENARLQDALVESQRVKASSDMMVEQIRDVARRAEVAKMEFARQSRIDKEVARNAPVHFKELYQSQLDEAKREVGELRAQVGILEAQSKLTGDKIRNRAARAEEFARKYQELVKRRDELFEDLYVAENERDDALFKLRDIQEKLKQTTIALSNPTDLHKLPELIQDIVSQSASSVRMGGYVTDSSEGDEGRRSNTGTTASFARLRPITGDDSSAVSGEDHERYYASAVEQPEVSQPKSINPRTLAGPSQSIEGSLGEETLVYACLWQSSSGCRQHSHSREGLLEHIFRDHVNL